MSQMTGMGPGTFYILIFWLTLIPPLALSSVPQMLFLYNGQMLTDLPAILWALIKVLCRYQVPLLQCSCQHTIKCSVYSRCCCLFYRKLVMLFIIYLSNFVIPNLLCFLYAQYQATCDAFVCFYSLGFIFSLFFHKVSKFSVTAVKLQQSLSITWLCQMGAYAIFAVTAAS